MLRSIKPFIGTRPLCKQCKIKVRAMGYRRGRKVYWRSLCDTCIRKKKKLRIGGITPLQRSGYKKKSKCELCGFKALEPLQLDIYFVDGNKNNIVFHNLKTICANCQRLASIKKLRWRIGDLEVDR